MYGLLIVDDEVHAAHGIESGIDWAALGVSDVYVAYNIRQAKEMFSARSIDLMICDIEMPQGNGLELLSWVKEHYETTECLFLTCHADFEYAKQALQLGSLDYLLKPVRYADLEAVVSKAIRKIETEREASKFTETLKHYYQLWSEHQPLLVERFWLDLINQTVSSQPEHIGEMMRKRNIPYEAGARFIPVLVSICGWNKDLTGRDEKIMEYALRNAAEHSLGLDGVKGGCVVQTAERTIFLFMPEAHLSASQNRLEETLKEYVDSCNKYFYCDLSCYVGVPTPLAAIHEAVGALLQMDLNNVTHSRKVYRLNEISSIPKQLAAPDIGHWLELLKQGEKAPLLAEMDGYFERMRQAQCDAKQLTQLYHDFLQMVYHVLQLKGLQAHLIFAEDSSPRQAAHVTRSVSHFQEWVKRVVETAIDSIRSVEESHTVIDRVKRYIAEHIEKDLSRDDIADYVFLSPDYLSRIFKKETGMSLSDYLIEEKFKFAQQILVQSDKPISEIAASIGYTNFSHFSKMFKRVTDMNPLEFRKKHRR
ncbi:response regulator transcription factor [Paenibacillus hamazuiensis]|uniref:response regulator transcription factor n=1 Tax=Paenibacillus hamazuiensis TaxID=2936508 RepID=UPI00200FF599|nr:response regulator [Paenibacillus hamazuiensis]